MVKQIMQDVVVKKHKEEDAALVTEPQPVVKAAPRSRPRPQTIEDSLEVPRQEVDHDADRTPHEAGGGGPSFAPIETSPIFEKMKRRNKDRESFSDEFTHNHETGGRKFFGKAVLMFVVLGFVLSFLYGVFFYDAIVEITPKSAEVAMQERDFVAGSGASSTIPFHLMTISGEESTELAATGEKNVSTKASGKIVIYNDFNTQNQRLIKNTRFQAPDGKIYRINESIDVPGQKTVDGKLVPGSLEVTVYADAPGAEYNIDLTDFTIPGFKGSPRYDKFYARSKTSMSGGFSGITKVVADTDVQKAREDLALTLKEKLLAEALAQKPKESVMYKNAAFYSLADGANTGAEGGADSDKKTVKFTLKGDITVMLFDSAELSKAVVSGAVTPVEISEGDVVLVQNIEELAFSFKNGDISAPKEGALVPFTLSGNAHAIWRVDVPMLLQKIAGTKKSEYVNVFAGMHGIEKANSKIRPFWKTRFPEDPSKIHVEITEIKN